MVGVIPWWLILPGLVLIVLSKLEVVLVVLLEVIVIFIHVEVL